MFFGALTFPSADAIATGQPTPWVGVWERINILMYLQWIGVLAIVLMRETPVAYRSVADAAPQQVPAPAATPSR